MTLVEDEAVVFFPIREPVCKLSRSMFFQKMECEYDFWISIRGSTDVEFERVRSLGQHVHSGCKMLWFENHLVVVVICIRYLVGGEAGEWVGLGDRGPRFMGEMEVKTVMRQAPAVCDASDLKPKGP